LNLSCKNLRIPIKYQRNHSIWKQHFLIYLDSFNHGVQGRIKVFAGPGQLAFWGPLGQA
jgi:hypothetical protein